MKKFKITTIVLASVGLVLILLAVLIFALRKNAVPGRGNTECETQERVFDYADVLTDGEEEDLRELIAETEPEIGCDIVLVTIEEPDLASDYMMMCFADDFYDNNAFGWNEPYGDGALYLDNWGRDAYGDAYSWFSTSGKVEDKYSTAMIDDLLDKVCGRVNDDPYSAYADYVKTLKRDMGSTFGLRIPWAVAPIAGLVAVVVFILMNLPAKAGKVTTGKQTYVDKEDVKLLNSEDAFLSKSVTHVRINTSSGGGGGGGGGGHHTSSGGHSHGGGGGRH